MKKTQRTFVFNPFWFEVLEQFSSETRLEVLTAINVYGSQGTVVELSPTAKMAFLFIKREMDYNSEQYQARVEKCRQAGRKGGLKRVDNLRSRSQTDAPASETKASKIKREQATPSYNDNEYDNVEDKSSSTTSTAGGAAADERLTYCGGYNQGYESTRLLDDFFADSSAIASFCRANGGVGVDRLRAVAEEVISQWRLADTRHKSQSDARRHLMYQLRIKLKCYQNEKLTPPTSNASTFNANQQNQLEIARLVQSKLADPFASQRDISQCY